MAWFCGNHGDECIQMPNLSPIALNSMDDCLYAKRATTNAFRRSQLAGDPLNSDATRIASKLAPTGECFTPIGSYGVVLR